MRTTEGEERGAEAAVQRQTALLPTKAATRHTPQLCPTLTHHADPVPPPHVVTLNKLAGAGHLPLFPHTLLKNCCDILPVKMADNDTNIDLLAPSSEAIGTFPSHLVLPT